MPSENNFLNSVYGVVIKVENLSLCRAFYRDVLQLGPPVMDSNFWVEFKLDNGSSLVLEGVSQGDKLPPGKGRIAWLCKVSDLRGVVTTLKEKGFEPVASEEEQGGIRVIQYCDPEGNPFYLCASK